MCLGVTADAVSESYISGIRATGVDGAVEELRELAFVAVEPCVDAPDHHDRGGRTRLYPSCGS